MDRQSPVAIDIYDYDGTLCDGKEFIDRLTFGILEQVITDHRGHNLTEGERNNLEYASLVDYTGFFWSEKAPSILRTFGIDYAQLDEGYKADLNAVRHTVRNRFYGQNDTGMPLNARQSDFADRIRSDLDHYFIRTYGAVMEYKPYDDVGAALDNPDTVKAIATQKKHHAIRADLQRFPEIGAYIGDRFTGTGFVDPRMGKITQPKPDPALILSQYSRLIDEFDAQGLDIRGVPVRMTGDSVLDVIAMRRAQNNLNEGRTRSNRVDFSVIGVVRKGPYAGDVADRLVRAAKDPDDPSGERDIGIHIVQDFTQHRDLTEYLDTMRVKGDFSSDYSF